MTRRLLWILLSLSLLATLAGCSLSAGSLVDTDQPRQAEAAALTLVPGQTVGQTFVARHGGLDGIEFQLLTPANRDSQQGTNPTLTLHLRTDSTSEIDLATVELRPTSTGNAGPGSAEGSAFSRFSFPAQAASHGQYYYAFLETTGAEVTVAAGPNDAYLDGAAYLNDEPLDAQLAFHLVYAPYYTLRDLLAAALEGLGLLVVAGLLFILPGWGLVAWLTTGRDVGWAEKLGLAAGVSLAVYPILFLWTDVVQLHLGPLYAWLPALLGLAGVVWHSVFTRSRTPLRQTIQDGSRAWLHSEHLLPDLALVGIVALMFGARLLAVRSIEVPMWGDSLQHSMIAQLLVDHRGLFDSWLPYAEIDRFTYHFGFHTDIAVLHWVTGLPVIASTLWAGQLLNGLAILAIYPLAVRVTGSRWGGVGAILFAGLLSWMPMSYTNWGRYTQLAGLAVLPAAVWFTWDLRETPEGRWQRLGRILIVVLVVSGLALTHYRILLFYACFVIALLLVSFTEGSARRLLRDLAWAGGGTAIVCFPWLLNAFGSTLQQMVVAHATTPPDQAHPMMEQYNAIGALDSYLHPIWWLALVAGLGLGLWRRRRAILIVGLWWFILLVAANPAWFSLPGTGLITNFTLFIAAYLPAALAIGYLASTLAESRNHRRWLQALAVVVTVALGAWGAVQRLSDIDPASYALVTRPDLHAAAWIRQNTAPESRFLINAFPAFGGTSVVGADAGWWLPLLAGRQTTVPPLAYSTELSLDSDVRDAVEAFAQQAEESQWDAPDMLNLLAEQGITHVYIGQRRGRLNNSGEYAIAPEQLLASPHYRAVYHQDGVWIFAVVPGSIEVGG